MTLRSSWHRLRRLLAGLRAPERAIGGDVLARLEHDDTVRALLSPSVAAISRGTHDRLVAAGRLHQGGGQRAELVIVEPDGRLTSR